MRRETSRRWAGKGRAVFGTVRAGKSHRRRCGVRRFSGGKRVGLLIVSLERV
jgi:hypothetical protein